MDFVFGAITFFCGTVVGALMILLAIAMTKGNTDE